MTAQNIPVFEWTEHALQVRAFLYQYWCDNGHGPTLRRVHEATGLSREEIIAAYKQLAFGEIVFDQMTQGFSMLKCPPFSSYPTGVEVHIDGKFHAFAGCAMESVAISKMPPFAGKQLHLESYCACCLEPITLDFRDGELLARSADSVLIHVSMPPEQWGIPSVMPMCDAMNYVLDADHAGRYERKIGKRGVVFTIEQAQPFVAGVANNRMWDYHWYPGPMRPDTIFDGIKALGVDVSTWEP